jgi:sialic acid synthase SpsE/mannose-6-phosphate isomerase-like protein (cupin superfamily)
MKTGIPKNLFILEMANNHMGDINHGVEVIRKFGEVCKEFPEFNFAFKLQYRNLDSFIHPNLKGNNDIKYIKRFEETKLSRKDFDLLITEMRMNRFLTIATPFDEDSVGVIVDQKLDFIKVASCSFSDWPLLEKIVETDLPIIASTAGATLEDIDRVVSFFQHRNKNFVIMHCVGEYPTPDEKLHASQIDFLKKRYPEIKIGFSTHENPDNYDVIKIAIAKGAEIFEKHVGLSTEKYSLNAYSASPEQVRKWLQAAKKSQILCGVGDKRLPPNQSEIDSLLSLRRGIYAKREISSGEILSKNDIYFAFPPQSNQYTANDFSKYSNFIAEKPIPKDSPIDKSNTILKNRHSQVWKAAQKVNSILKESKVVVPGGVDLELSHHYGIDRFEEVGLTMITVVNRAYCKKLLVSLPNQFHPEQYHNQKEETFHILFGTVHVNLNGKTLICTPGTVLNIEPGVRHSFISPTGCVIEEVSSTHYINDSFYTDESINQNKARKTLLTYWMS